MATFRSMTLAEMQSIVNAGQAVPGDLMYRQRSGNPANCRVITGNLKPNVSLSLSWKLCILLVAA